jgi:hypothetical protein
MRCGAACSKARTDLTSYPFPYGGPFGLGHKWPGSGTKGPSGPPPVRRPFMAAPVKCQEGEVKNHKSDDGHSDDTSSQQRDDLVLARLSRDFDATGQQQHIHLRAQTQVVIRQINARLYTGAGIC